MVRKPQVLCEVLAGRPEILQQTGEVLLRNDGKTVGGDDLGGLFGVVGAEDEDSLSIQQEGVQVGDADTFAREDLDGVGGLAGTVVEFDGEHLAERDGHSGFPEDVVSLFRLRADDAADTIIDGIGDGRGDQLDILLLEKPEHADERAGLVLDEDGKLMDSHIRVGL